MKYRPILFSGPMVVAILDGRKTQTRRVIANQCAGDEFSLENGVLTRRNSTGFEQVRAPYDVGDRLWVRETTGHEFLGPEVMPGVRSHCRLVYRATEPDVKVERWRPAIHMPRSASRIMLEVTDVRVQCVQAINEGDAIAEGTMDVRSKHGVPTRMKTSSIDGLPVRTLDYIEAFRIAWDSINSKRPGCTWADNPAVVALTFKRIQEGVVAA